MLVSILKKSRILAAAITGAVAVVAVYQLVTKQSIDSAVLDVATVLVTYWLGVFTPAPATITSNDNGK